MIGKGNGNYYRSPFIVLLALLIVCADTPRILPAWRQESPCTRFKSQGDMIRLPALLALLRSDR